MTRKKKQFCLRGHDTFVLGRDGDGHCKGCRKILRRKQYQKNKEKETAYNREYKKKHRDKFNALARESMRQHPERRRRYMLKNINGILPEVYDELFKKQSGRCAICGTTKPDTLSSGKKYLSLDHDHRCCSGIKSCGKCIRGLLCGNCNRGLGQFKDNVLIMKKACNYLLNYEKRKINE